MHPFVSWSLQLWSPVFTGFPGDRTRDRDGETGEKGCTSLEEMPTEVTERESGGKEKFTKQLFIRVNRGREGGAGLHRASVLLC